MLRDDEIEELVTTPKRIINRTPVGGYREENRHRRCELDLQSESDVRKKFTMFVRQSLEFHENFSIGLRYLTRDPVLGRLVLVRYNGPHGEISRSPDGHFAVPHIHRINEQSLLSENAQPQEKLREIAGRYGTYAEALRVFVADTGITNPEGFFPELMQGRLFDGN